MAGLIPRHPLLAMEENNCKMNENGIKRYLDWYNRKLFQIK
jgi:hypothetical protein